MTDSGRRSSSGRIQIDFYYKKWSQLGRIHTGFCALFTVHWLHDCREIVLIHPERPSKKKTDRRDAHKLCDLLWLNRDRLSAGKPVHGLRRIYLASKQEQEDRQITILRQGLGRRRTRVLNKLQRILHRYNLMWEYVQRRITLNVTSVAKANGEFAGHTIGIRHSIHICVTLHLGNAFRNRLIPFAVTSVPLR